MQDFHKLMQCFQVINAKDVSDIWKTIEENKTNKEPRHDVGEWHSADGKVFALEIGILNSGGRMLNIHIGPDGKFVAAIVLPDMD